MFDSGAIRTPRRAAQVCGVVVSVRQHEDILSVWTQDSKDDDAIAKIRDAIKTNLELPPFVTIDYKRHAFHGGQGRAWGGRKQQGDRPHHRRQDRGPRQHHREEAPPPPAERDWGALRRK